LRCVPRSIPTLERSFSGDTFTGFGGDLTALAPPFLGVFW
jgi:hypothetical protein